jgi:hypothetical protein
MNLAGYDGSGKGQRWEEEEKGHHFCGPLISDIKQRMNGQRD